MTPEQYNLLCHHCVLVAKGLLERFGEFNAFGAGMRSDGQIDQLAYHDGDEYPDVQTVVDGLTGAMFSALADGEYMGTVLAMNVNIPVHLDTIYPDGVRLDLYLPDAEATSYVPYVIRRQGLLRRKTTVEFAASVALMDANS